MAEVVDGGIAAEVGDQMALAQVLPAGPIEESVIFSGVKISSSTIWRKALPCGSVRRTASPIRAWFVIGE